MIRPSSIKTNSQDYIQYLEKISILSRESNTIAALYETKLQCLSNKSLEKQIFIEKYAEIMLSPTIIYNTLLKILYNYKVNALNKNKLLDILNTEFLKVNICFENNESMAIPRYPDSGIVWAETDKLIYIYVNDIFINILNNTDILKPTKDFDNLVHDLFNMYSHEITHNYQQTNTKKAIPTPNIDNRKEYLSHPWEIDANAREVASQLLKKYTNFKDIQNLLLNNSNKLLQNEIWEEYYRYFGAYEQEPSRNIHEKERLWRINIFKKFKKRIYDFLLLDKKFLGESLTIYDILKQL